MSVVNWGLLAKSLEDDETIEEAIDRLIEAHNEDEASHLEEGQSLQSHKAEEIIDHVVGSVVADKMTATEGLLETSFESLDGWSQSGSVSLESWGYLNLYVEGVVEPESAISAVLLHSGNWLDWSKNHMIQGVFFHNVSGDHIVLFCVGDVTSVSVYTGYGFRIEDGVVKGFLRTNLQTTATADLSVDATDQHIYRALFNAVAAKVYFYVDGVEKASIALTGSPAEYEPEIYFLVNSKDDGDGNLKVSKLTTAREE